MDEQGLVGGFAVAVDGGLDGEQLVGFDWGEQAGAGQEAADRPAKGGPRRRPTRAGISSTQSAGQPGTAPRWATLTTCVSLRSL